MFPLSSRLLSWIGEGSSLRNGFRFIKPASWNHWQAEYCVVRCSCRGLMQRLVVQTLALLSYSTTNLHCWHVVFTTTYCGEASPYFKREVDVRNSSSSLPIKMELGRGYVGCTVPSSVSFVTSSLPLACFWRPIVTAEFWQWFNYSAVGVFLSVCPSVCVCVFVCPSTFLWVALPLAFKLSVVLGIYCSLHWRSIAILASC